MRIGANSCACRFDRRLDDGLPGGAIRCTSTIKIAFFAASAISSTSPICSIEIVVDLSAVQYETGPRSASGTGENTTRRGTSSHIAGEHEVDEPKHCQADTTKSCPPTIFSCRTCRSIHSRCRAAMFLSRPPQECYELASDTPTAARQPARPSA